MTMKRHAARCIGQGGRDASMSDAHAVGQFVAQAAFDGYPVAMEASEFSPEQRSERDPGQEVANLLCGQFGMFHGKTILFFSRPLEEASSALAAAYAHGYDTVARFA